MEAIPFQCNICKQRFPTRQKLLKHKEQHEGSFECGICKKTFASHRNLQLHQIVHNGKRPHKCQECGKKFRRRETLTRHKRTHSRSITSKDNETPHNVKKNREQILQVQHEGSFECSICKKTFACHQNLQVHQTVHTGERPHECKICGKRFRLKKTLKIHKCLHSKERIDPGHESALANPS